MTISPDLEAQILRYYHVEKWRVGTIARQLHVHHGTVARVLGQAGLPRIGPPVTSTPRPATIPLSHACSRNSWRRCSVVMLVSQKRETHPKPLSAQQSRSGVQTSRRT